MNFVVDFLHYIVLMGKPETASAYLSSIDQLKVSANAVGSTYWPWHISHPSFLHWNRMLTVLFGASTVAVTYNLSRFLCNRWVALTAAALIACIPYHIHASARVLPDVPAGLFFLTVVTFSIAFIERKNRAYFFLSLIFCGAVAATKLNGGVSIVAPIMTLAYLQLRREECVRGYDWFWVFLIPAAAFIAFMPFALVDFTTFMKNFGTHVRIYKVIGSGSGTIEPGWTHLVFQISEFRREIGLLPLVLSFIGIIYVFFKPVRIIAFAAIAVYLIFFLGTKVNYHRNLIIVYPFMAISISFGIYILFLGLERLKQFVPERAGVWKDRLPWLAVVVAVLAIAPNAYVAVGDAWEYAGKKDSRTLAGIDVGKRKRQGNIPQVLIAAELRVHENDLKKIGVPYRVVTMSNIRACKIPRQRSLVVVPERLKVFFAKNQKSYKDTLNAHIWLLKRMKRGKVVAKFGGSVTNLDVLTSNPTVVIAEIDLAAPC